METKNNNSGIEDKIADDNSVKTNKNKTNSDVKRLCGMAIFVAFAVVATLLTK